ncbi:MAG: TauD/TfdA family dioxygenase [Pseudomonadota bacterium]
MHHHRVIDHPSAWRAADFGCKADFATALTAIQVDRLRELAARAAKIDKPIEEITLEDVNFPSLTADLSNWREAVLNGRGILLLTGFSLEGLSQRECEAVFWWLGLQFGQAQSQSVLGDRLGHVVGSGGKDPSERAYRNSLELALHTDTSDVVAMFCLRKALSGGLSGYCSGPSIYNAFVTQRPELLAPMMRGFHYHRFGEEGPGESPITPQQIPVFSYCDDVLSVSYLRGYIDMAMREMGRAYSDEELAALTFFEETASRPDMMLTFMLEPGELVFFHNYSVLHTRTAFEDAPNPAERRHLLRLWLNVPDARPTLAALRPYGGAAGITPQEDRKSARYRGETPYVEFPNND